MMCNQGFTGLKDEYSKELCMTYLDLCKYLQQKYGINDIEKCFHAIAALSEAANIMALANKLAKVNREE